MTQAFISTGFTSWLLMIGLTIMLLFAILFTRSGERSKDHSITPNTVTWSCKQCSEVSSFQPHATYPPGRSGAMSRGWQARRRMAFENKLCLSCDTKHNSKVDLVYALARNENIPKDVVKNALDLLHADSLVVGTIIQAAKNLNKPNPFCAVCSSTHKKT